MYTALMIRLPRPDDFHVHLRQGPALTAYAQDHARVFGRALIMPNTLPPIRNAADLMAYRNEIKLASKPVNPQYEPLMSFKIPSIKTLAKTESVNSFIQELKTAGAIAGKLYPAGVTTNSADGVGDLEEIYPLFEAMQDAGIYLCVHGEEPDAFCLDRERAFLPRLNRVVCDFPRLKIVLEHVSTAAAVEWVSGQPDRVAASVTVQHLLHTLDDMLGGHLQPHLFCKPLLKRPEDRQAIQAAVLSASPRFFFGSDSAPHSRIAKECDCGAAGVYSAPVALPLLAEFFETADKLKLLPDFVSRFGAEFYGLPLAKDELVMVRKPWMVPNSLHDGIEGFPIGGVVPMAAGQELAWVVEGWIASGSK